MSITYTVICLLKIFLYILAISSISMAQVWLVLELCVLSLIPLFFSSYFFSNSYKGLLYYLLLSGLSSAFMFSGFILPYIKGVLIYVAFLIKFYVFPLCLWLYVVSVKRGWLVLWLITCVGKIISPMLGLLIDDSFIYLSRFFCGRALIFTRLYFFTGCTKSTLLWCKIRVSSSSLIFLFFSHSKNYWLYLYLGYYLVWGRLCMLLLSLLQYKNYRKSYFSLILLTLFSTPLLLSFWYKLFTITILLKRRIFSRWIIVFYSIYSFCEQYYVGKLWFYDFSNSCYSLL